MNGREDVGGGKDLTGGITLVVKGLLHFHAALG